MEARTDHPSALHASAGSWLARPLPASALLVLAVALVLTGQELLRPPARPGAALGAYALGLALIVVLERLAPRPPAPAADAMPVQAAAGRGRLGQRVLLAAVFGGAAAIWALMRARQVADTYTDVVAVWVATLVVAVLASAARTWPPRGQRVCRLQTALARDRATVGLAALLFLVAFLLRGVALDGFPYVFGGDEGSEAMWAVAVLSGRWTDPFATGWYNLPTLWFFLQATSMRLFGESVAGVRMVTAVIGALTVLFTYLLARRLYGPAVGLSAALLLAAFHYHVFFSRVASLQVLDTLTIVAALYWLDRGFEGARPTACLLAGYAVGFAQYGSFAGRLVPLVAVAYVVAHVARTAFARVGAPAVWVRELRLIGWVALGAALVVLPLFIHYVDHPMEFNRRVNEVSIFASGWLANEQAASGQSAAELILRQIARAALLPVATNPDGWYHPDPPLAGWPLAGLIVIGLALVSAHAFRREYVALAAAYWGAVLGVGLTDVPGATQRFVIVAPLLAVFAAVGLEGLLRIARDLGGVRPVVVRALGAGVVGGLVAWNLLYYFQLPDDNRLYGDENSLIATRVGHVLRTDHPGAVAFFFGGPRMVARGFESLGFIAHGAPIFDVEEPWASRAMAPTTPIPKVFVFLPHRLAELAQIREWFPAGEGREFHGPTGSLLFYLYAAP